MTHFDHQVRERAYYIWEDEGRIFGRAEDHWLRAESELRARFPAEPVLVQAVAPALTLSASPAQVLGETLKAKPSRSRTVTAEVESNRKVDAKAKTGAKAAAEPAPKAGKAPVKAAAAPKSVTLKSATSKSATSKAAATTKGAQSPKAAARPRAGESAATVH